MSKVLIGIPTQGTISVGTSVFISKQAQKGHSIYYTPSTISVVTARIRICSYFLNSNFTHLFFLDSDIKCDNNAIERLLLHEKPVVSISCPIYLHRHLQSNIYTLQNSAYFPYALDKAGFHQVDGCGLGACLIERSVIERAMKCNPFMINYGPTGEAETGEDIHFSEVLKLLNIPIYCDFDIWADHYKTLSLRDLFDTLVLSKEIA